MFDFVASQGGFITLLALFAAGMIGSVATSRRNQLANLLGNGFAVAGALWGLLLGILDNR